MATDWVRNLRKASIVAKALVSLFGVRPRHLEVASFTPAKAKTKRTEPPAFKPCPILVGFMITRAALYFAST